MYPYPYVSPDSSGRVDNSFDEYAQNLARAPGAIIAPQLYEGEASTESAPMQATMGMFVSAGALVDETGPWWPAYEGLLPEAQRPRLSAPEPFADPTAP
jgi:hypothetical protein